MLGSNDRCLLFHKNCSFAPSDGLKKYHRSRKFYTETFFPVLPFALYLYKSFLYPFPQSSSQGFSVPPSLRRACAHLSWTPFFHNPLYINVGLFKCICTFVQSYKDPFLNFLVFTSSFTFFYITSLIPTSIGPTKSTFSPLCTPPFTPFLSVPSSLFHFHHPFTDPPAYIISFHIFRYLFSKRSGI